MKNKITIIDNTLKFQQSLDKTLKINNPNYHHIINSYYIQLYLEIDGQELLFQKTHIMRIMDNANKET